MSTRGIRNIQFHQYRGATNGPKIKAVNVRGSRSSGAAIVPGRLLVQETAGVNAWADGYKTADGTSAASRLCFGLCVGVATKEKGVMIDRQYIAADGDGIAYYLPADDYLILRGMEDGASSLIDSVDDYSSGMMGIDDGTITPGITHPDTNFPSQFSNDKLDSSDYHASNSKIATLLGMTPGPENYTQARVATGTSVLSSDTVGSVTITDGGFGYTATPLVAFSGGGGASAAGTAVLTNGVVTSVTITNAGSSYETEPTVTFTQPARVLLFKITSAYRAGVI